MEGAEGAEATAAQLRWLFTKLWKIDTPTRLQYDKKLLPQR